MIVTREMIVATARGWARTPFRHQGQLRGKACDCKGLVVGVAADLEMPEAQSLAALQRNYGRSFAGRALLDGLSATLIRTRVPQPADVLAILLGRDPLPRHLAILTEPGRIIHAYGGGVKFVAEVPLGSWRVHSAWTWPSLGEARG